jgi:tetratricopeptide (TPR) repeat protein
MDHVDYVIDLVEWYSEVLAEDPNSEVFAPLAEALYRDGRWDEAVEACSRGLGARPQHMRGRVILGLALLQLGRAEEGRQELERVRWEIERNAELYNALAGLASNEGDGDRAGRLLEIYRNMQPDDALAMLGSLPPPEIRLSAETSYARLPAAQPKGWRSGAVSRPSSAPEAFLRLWLQRAEEKRAAPPKPLDLFGDEERQILRNLLRESAANPA